MKYSLINVTNEANGKIDGYWVQNHVGTLETAKEVAKQTEAANSNKIKVAVVAEIPFQAPYNFLKGLERLGGNEYGYKDN